MGSSVLLFLVLSLVTGAATRHLLRRTQIPYTVALLLLGIALGAAERLGSLEHGALHHLGRSVEVAAAVDPHLILFLFLPTLVFESAFSLDVHVLRRTLVQVLILAVPGLLLAVVATAALAKVLFSGWSFTAALVFGAVVSPTDPVAVVALLKELGVSKRLGTLIEGESLLNDGTGVVVFALFFALMTSGSMASPVHVAREFLLVAVGGIAVGAAVAFLAISWIRRVFNDALVEITVTIAAAYLTFFIAEELHVSGILAVVTLGVGFAAAGRTRISPEVEGFLHRFWMMMAFIANTVIFILVGVVIAERSVWEGASAWVSLLLLYVGVQVIRGAVNLILSPLLKRTGYGLTWQENAVLTWGGLRGAVGLSLALVVAQAPSVPPLLGERMLSLCAGIVVLTLVVNGMTMRALVERLGMTTIGPARAATLRAAVERLSEERDKSVDLLKQDEQLTGADWERVRSYLPALEAPSDLGASTELELTSEVRRRLLEAEKRAYWRQHHEGLLGAAAVRVLCESADACLDGQGPLDGRAEVAAHWRIPRALSRLLSGSNGVVESVAKRVLFQRLSFGHEVARGFLFAQTEVRDVLDALSSGIELPGHLRAEVEANCEEAIEATRALRAAFPEVNAAIETRAAARTLLNRSRAEVSRLFREGALEETEHDALVAEVEEGMKRLHDEPPAARPLGMRELLKEISWLQALAPDRFERVVSACRERVFSPGDVLVQQGEEGDGIFVIARGSARVTVDVGRGDDLLVGVLGPGSVIGEMAVLTGKRRTATVRAATPAAALWIGCDDLTPLLAESPEIESRLWKTAAMRFAENLLVQEGPLRRLGRLGIRRQLLEGKVAPAPEGGGSLTLDGVIVLVAGTARGADGEEISPPALLPRGEVELSEGARVFICPDAKDEGDATHDLASAYAFFAERGGR